MDRPFLDANILFSAAYERGAGLLRLWREENVTLLTSSYAIDEARRNMDRAQRARLFRLLRRVTTVPTPEDRPMPKGVVLPLKDQPILLAAIEAQATHLLTGDVKHFGKYYGQRIEGVLILPPAEYRGTE